MIGSVGAATKEKKKHECLYACAQVRQHRPGTSAIPSCFHLLCSEPPTRSTSDPLRLPPLLLTNVFAAEKVRQGWKTEQKLKQPAWEEFLAVCRVLKRYGALEDVRQSAPGGEGGSEDRVEPKPTAFGRMLGAINADNELWMALVLTRLDGVWRLFFCVVRGLLSYTCNLVVVQHTILEYCCHLI